VRLLAKNIRWQAIIALLGSLLLIAFLRQLAAGRTTVLVPAVGGRYVEALIGYPQSINPLLARYGTPERDLCALIFSGLTRAEADGEIEPELAERWEISADSLLYTFHLRKDVRWQDGEPFTARDVVFTVRLIQSPDFAGPPELATAWRGIRVQMVDAYTVLFRLPQAYAPFLEQTTIGLLPSHLLSEMSPAEVTSYRFNKMPVGTGPFRLETLTAEYARLVPHPQFYGPRPYLGRVDFRFYPDARRALAAYSQGEVLGVGGIPAALLDQLTSQPDVDLFSSMMHEYTLVMLNSRQPVFADRRVRQALAYGLDRQALIDDVLNGQGIVAHSPILPGHWAYEPEVKRYHQNIERAKSLLDEVGWRRAESLTNTPEDAPLGERRDEDGQPFAFKLLTDDDQLHQQLAEALADQWSRLDAQVTVQVVSPSVRDDYVYNYQFDAVLLKLALPADPDLYPWWHSTQAQGGQNYAGLNNFVIDEALQQARLVTDRGQRWAFYRTFQKMFAEEVPAILLYYPIYTYGLDRRVRNVQAAPLLEPAHRFRDIHRWYLITQRVIVQQSPTPVR
jgi:peptide/nickel transport system substrate-binding protein